MWLKKLFLLVIVLALCVASNAPAAEQQRRYSYFYHGQIISLKASDERVAVKGRHAPTAGVVRDSLSDRPALQAAAAV